MNDAQDPKPIVPFEWSTIATAEDDRHIAAALEFLHRAIALKHQQPPAHSTVHMCLREASKHCELARRWWTKEQLQEMRKVEEQLFGMASIRDE